MRIRRNALLLLLAVVLLPVAAAYVQWAVFGLPPVPASPEAAPEATAPHGFPAWLRVTHYVNFLLLILLVRSGLPAWSRIPSSSHWTRSAPWRK